MSELYIEEDGAAITTIEDLADILGIERSNLCHEDLIAKTATIAKRRIQKTDIALAEKSEEYEELAAKKCLHAKQLAIRVRDLEVSLNKAERRTEKLGALLRRSLDHYASLKEAVDDLPRHA